MIYTLLLDGGMTCPCRYRHLPCQSDRLDLSDHSRRKHTDYSDRHTRSDRSAGTARASAIHAGLVVIHADLGDHHLPGEAEPAVVRRGPDAVFVVAVQRDRRAARVRHRYDRAQRVGLEAAAVGQSRAGIPDQRIVIAVAMDVAMRLRAIFYHHRVAVVQPVDRLRRRHQPPQTPQRIIGQRRRRDARARHQPVLGVVGVGAGAVAGQVAVGVVAEARRARGGILVEPVDRIGAAEAHIAGERIEIARAATLNSS